MNVKTSSLRGAIATKQSKLTAELAGLLRFARNDAWILVALLCVLLSGTTAVHAADKIRAGKAINVIWAMIPLDIGEKEGLFAKYGVDVDIITMSGGAKLQQGLIAGSIDIGIDGGTALVFGAKGSPVVGIAAVAGAPSNFAVVVAGGFVNQQDRRSEGPAARRRDQRLVSAMADQAPRDRARLGTRRHPHRRAWRLRGERLGDGDA